jgi:hypothetical protein
MIDVGNDPLAHYNFVYMSSSSSTLNDDADCVPQDVEKPAIAPKDQPRTAEGPTKEFIFFPIPRYLRHIPGDSIEFHLPRIFLLSISTIFCKVFSPESTGHFLLIFRSVVANMSYCQPLLSKRSPGPGCPVYH